MQESSLNNKNVASKAREFIEDDYNDMSLALNRYLRDKELSKTLMTGRNDGYHPKIVKNTYQLSQRVRNRSLITGNQNLHLKDNLTLDTSVTIERSSLRPKSLNKIIQDKKEQTS